MSEVQSAEERSSEEGVLLPEYRAVSGSAVAGLLLGLAGILAFVHPVFWSVPLAAVVVCGIALRQVAAQSSALVGRRAALIGLAVALICGISAPLQFFLYRYQLRVDAARTANEWFTAIRENRPYVAHQLTLLPEARWSLDEAGLVKRYAGDAAGLRSYVEKPTVQLLLTLGKQCHVRYYEHVGMRSDPSSQNVLDIYAVTVESQGRRVTFLVRVSLIRSYHLATKSWQWRVSQTEFIQAPPGEMGVNFGGF
ncbi:MAG TPA: hypothetical protein VFW87_23330 [Pirellulales bacterium]|nr:hypothetical protein [Pirellulales bacterium]